MFESTLEDSWFYQEIIQKGIEQGIEQGMEKGIEQGELKTLRSVLIRFVETHFPELKTLAQRLAEQTTTNLLLESTVNEILLSQTTEQARLILTEAQRKIDDPS